MPEINLLPEVERREISTKRLKTRVTVLSVTALVFTILVSIVVFGFWAILVRQEKQLGVKIGSLEQQIQSLANVETLARVLKNKLSQVLIITGKLTNFEKVLTDVSQVTPAGVTLSDLTVSDQNLITLTGSAISASEFSTLVSTLLRQDVGGVNFANVAVESISRDDKGIYKFTISAKLKLAQR